MFPRDPFGDAERSGFMAESRSLLRHGARNRLGSIRNAAYYLRRRSSGTPLWQEYPRFEQFFALIESELAALEQRAVTVIAISGQPVPEMLARVSRLGAIAGMAKRAAARNGGADDH